MAVTVSTHRKVIETIDRHWRTGAPFAIWEVRDASGVSTSSIVRCLRRLQDLRLVIHKDRVYADRHYRVAPRWTNAKDVLENYQYAKMLGY